MRKYNDGFYTEREVLTMLQTYESFIECKVRLDIISNGECLSKGELEEAVIDHNRQYKKDLSPQIRRELESKQTIFV